MKFILILIISQLSLMSYSPPESEKPFVETYKLSEFPERQNIIKFMKAGLIISSHCVTQKNKKYSRRECDAWKPMDLLESGKYKKYFTPNKVLPDTRNPKLVSFFLCQQSGGNIATEVSEFSAGRDAEPMDFCQFPDKSLLSLLSIQKFIEGIPNFSQTVTFD